MRKPPRSLAFLACLSLIAWQLGGVHMHVDETGYVGVPEAAHTHTHGAHHHDADHDGGHPHDDDYEGATDVSIVDLLSGVSKLSVDLILLTLLLPVMAWQASRVIPVFAGRVLSGRYTRWRPPLRAPPLIS